MAILTRRPAALPPSIEHRHKPAVLYPSLVAVYLEKLSKLITNMYMWRKRVANASPASWRGWGGPGAIRPAVGHVVRTVPSTWSLALTVLVVLTTAAPPILAEGDDQAISSLSPDEDDLHGYLARIGSEVGKHLAVIASDHGPNEPMNDLCETAIAKEPLTHRVSTGAPDDALGPGDVDWAPILRFHTETLVAKSEGAGTVFYASPCGTFSNAPVMTVASGHVPISVGGLPGPYTLTWHVTSNDKFVPGHEIGNGAEAAEPVNVLPSTAPAVPVYGSLPNRPDQLSGPDEDWFRLNTPLAEIPSEMLEEGNLRLALGLVTARLNADCFAGKAGLRLYQPNGITPIGVQQIGCSLSSSCISIGLGAVHTQASSAGGRGTAYEFSASVSP